MFCLLTLIDRKLVTCLLSLTHTHSLVVSKAVVRLRVRLVVARLALITDCSALVTVVLLAF